MNGPANYFLTALAQTLTVGGNNTTIEFSTIFTQDGQVIETADFAQYGRGIITINPLSLSSVEFASFTSVNPALGANGGVAGVLRGLSFKGNDQIPANQKFNVIGTPVIISFGVHNLLDLPTLVGTNTYTGLNAFTTFFPTTPSSAPTTSYQVANKKYVDDAFISGGTPASTTNLGLVKMSIAPVDPASPTAVGDNDLRMAPTTGTSGGIMGWTSTTVRASSVLMTNHALIVGGGAGATPTPLASLGTTTTVLHGNASGDPTFGAVSLTADVSGVLPVANGGTGSATANGHFTLISTVTLSAVSLTSGSFTKIAEWTGLTGDTDDEYMIEYECALSGAGGTSSVLGLRLNDDSTANHYDYTGIRMLGGSATVTGVTAQNTYFRMGAAGTNNLDFFFGTAQVKASKTIAGTARFLMSRMVGGTGSATTTIDEQEKGWWSDTSTQVTSAQIYFSQTSGGTLTISGKASLYKINR